MGPEALTDSPIKVSMSSWRQQELVSGSVGEGPFFPNGYKALEHLTANDV